MRTLTKPDILIVDDNQNLLITLGDLLEFEGYSVRTAENGEDALLKIEFKAPDLIVLDISMPGMGGIGFLKRIAVEGGTLRYPVLVLTARAAMEPFFRDVAVDGFVAKPCSEQDLLRKIREILLNRNRLADPAFPHQVRRVLLAEDDAAAAESIRSAFGAQSRPYSVTVAGKGPEVLEQALVIEPDLLVMKDSIHGMRGEELLALLGMMPKTSTTPVILYSRDGELPPSKSSEYPGKVRRLAGADAWTLVQVAVELLTA